MKRTRETVAQQIIERLRRFTEHLESGEPLEPTYRVTSIPMPRGFIEAGERLMTRLQEHRETPEE